MAGCFRAEAVVYDWQKQLGIDTITIYKVENLFEARLAGDYDLSFFS